MNEIKIKEFISTLSTEQKSTLLTILREKRIYKYQTLLSEIFTDNKSVTDIKEERFSNGLFCTRCGCTTNIVKAGRGVNNKQRYLCKNCSKIFTSTTDTFLSFTKKSLDVWKKYIECMVRKYSIRKSADECNITIRTSFMWRHKILDALRLSDKTELSGIVEADETFFRVSYKGSRNIDRKSRRRGGEVHKRGLSTEQVCVVCSIERDSKESISK
ncbi:MAG: IS1595 family transposase, partial [Desulfovibrio sp.]|nr:IS1595 family transposase [Desulfovibrio sp.]